MFAPPVVFGAAGCDVVQFLTTFVRSLFYSVYFSPMVASSIGAGQGQQRPVPLSGFHLLLLFASGPLSLFSRSPFSRPLADSGRLKGASCIVGFRGHLGFADFFFSIQRLSFLHACIPSWRCRLVVSSLLDTCSASAALMRSKLSCMGDSTSTWSYVSRRKISENKRAASSANRRVL